MATLLRDVGDAIAANDQPSLSFVAPTMDEGPEKERDAQDAAADIMMNKDQVVKRLKGNQDVATNVGDTCEQQGASIEVIGNVSPRSPPLYSDAPRSVTAGIRDDVPSCNLLQKGSEDYEWMHSTDDNAKKVAQSSPLTQTSPCFMSQTTRAPSAALLSLVWFASSMNILFLCYIRYPYSCVLACSKQTLLHILHIDLFLSCSSYDAHYGQENC